MKGENLVFLISQPRSGSTLLQRVLQNHPEIHSTPEPWLMLHPLYSLRKHGIETEYNAAWAKSAVQDFCKNLPNGEESYFEALGQMYGSLYETILQASGKRLFLDKTPRYYHVIPELTRTFPSAKFIILFRNPLAVLCSMVTTWIQQDWYKLESFQHDLMNAPKLLLDATNFLNSEQLVTVQYEQLLTSPEKIVRRLCEHLKIDFSLNMLSPQPADQTGFGFMEQSQKLLQSGLEAQNLDRWITALKDTQTWRLSQDYLNFLGPKVIEDLGYSYEELESILLNKKPQVFSCWRTRSLMYWLNHSGETISLSNKVISKGKEMKPRSKKFLAKISNLNITQNF